jgi:hypothetical protein
VIIDEAASGVADDCKLVSPEIVAHPRIEFRRRGCGGNLLLKRLNLLCCRVLKVMIGDFQLTRGLIQLLIGRVQLVQALLESANQLLVVCHAAALILFVLF